MGLAKSIQYCAVIDKLGYVVASKHRQNLNALMTNAESRRQALQAAIRHFKRQSWEQNLGRIYYSSTRYEKAIGATIPVGIRYLMLLVLDPETKHFDAIIMDKVIPLIEEYQAPANFS